MSARLVCDICVKETVEPGRMKYAGFVHVPLFTAANGKPTTLEHRTNESHICPGCMKWILQSRKHVRAPMVLGTSRIQATADELSRFA